MKKKQETVEADSVIAKNIVSDRELLPYSASGYHFKDRAEAERFAKALGSTVVDRSEAGSQ